jgi:hypothetical protein
MFVAALSHDDDASSRDVQSEASQQPARDSVAKDPWDAHINALARAKQAARGWVASGQAVGR